MMTPKNAYVSKVKSTNKQGDSKSDVLLCFDTKFTLNLLKCIINFLKVISISKEYFI